MKKGSRLEFYFILIGGLMNLFFAINLLSPVFTRQLWALYYLLFGVFLISLSFRISKGRNVKRDAWFVIIIGLFSLNPVPYLTLDGPFFNPLPLIGGIIALIRSHFSSHSQETKGELLPPPNFPPKKVILTPVYQNNSNPLVAQRKPFPQRQLYRPQFSSISTAQRKG